MNKDILILVAVLAFMAAGAAGVIYMGSRGLRNNNPGNIRHSSSKWQGLSKEQTDREYVQFDDPVYGIRALTKLLQNYQSRHGLKTIRQIINRYAPPSENITDAYVANVSRLVGVNPDAEINVGSYMTPLVKAIIQHENGEQPYSPEIISQGISLA